MRLVEFLIQLLEAHAQTLKRLAALFGEENLIELLERAGDDEKPCFKPSRYAVPLQIFERPSLPLTQTDPYRELEGAVQEMNLPEVLAFHLWAYPQYRAFIESPLDLDSRLPGPGGDAGAKLVEDTVSEAESWVRSLPMSPQVLDQACQAAYVPWLKFRATMLKRVGRRPLGPVY